MLSQGEGGEVGGGGAGCGNNGVMIGNFLAVAHLAVDMVPAVCASQIVTAADTRAGTALSISSVRYRLSVRG